MRAQPVAAAQNRRIVASLPFVEALARRMAASMPNSIDIGDLVQDGVLGLIDAARRFDEGRGIKFETFAERRVRGAMIDALRRDAWPRGVRRQRRELGAGVPSAVVRADHRDRRLVLLAAGPALPRPARRGGGEAMSDSARHPGGRIPLATFADLGRGRP